jgi:hypothetical protein
MVPSASNIGKLAGVGEGELPALDSANAQRRFVGQILATGNQNADNSVRTWMEGKAWLWTK